MDIVSLYESKQYQHKFTAYRLIKINQYGHVRDSPGCNFKSQKSTHGLDV